MPLPLTNTSDKAPTQSYADALKSKVGYDGRTSQHLTKTSIEKRNVTAFDASAMKPGASRPRLQRRKRKLTTVTEVNEECKEKVVGSPITNYFKRTKHELSQEVKSPSPSEAVKSPSPSEEVKSPSPSEEVKSPSPSEAVKSPSPSGEVKSPSPSEDWNIESLLPLQGPGMTWYKERGINAAANSLRTVERLNNTVISEDNQMIGLIRGSVKGSLEQNIDELIEKLSSAGSQKQQRHFSTLISLARYIMDNGLIIATQDLAKIYKEFNCLKDSYHIESATLLEILSKHLNVAQIYIEGKGYITENRGIETIKLVESLQKIGKNDQKIVNRKVEEAVGESYATVLQYLDSKRDQDTLKSVLTNITSVNFMTKLGKVQDKRSFQRTKGLVAYNLQLFDDMKNSMEVDDESLNDEAKRRKKIRMLQKMKIEKLRHVFRRRGRKLKSEQFPDLAGILEFAFGDGDRVDRAGGGLESHPRLTDTVLYRAADSNTIMRHARETILALAPEVFDISLSSCFNYTQNYREGTYQAKRHHSGKGINACLSLHKPPRTGVEQFVINLHWSTQNVNLTLDFARASPDNVMVDSKDAKAKVHADVSPVQKPSKTWRKITLPDHDWCRLAHNAVTPMSHLFVLTEVILEEEEDEKTFYSVRRTGTAATMINISYFEPETVQRVFNEIFLLLVNPALDHVFRNPNTGKLKEHFVFIVDNGHYRYDNAHCLLHLQDCVKNIGPLWVNSCFWFEDYNGDLRKLFHGTQRLNCRLISFYVCIQQKIPELIPLLPCGSSRKEFYENMTSGSRLLKCKQDI